MKEVVIVDGVRSPIGRYGGGLAGVRPDDLLAAVYKELMARGAVDPARLDEVFAGCGNQAGEDNRDVARMSVLLAGFPVEVPGGDGQPQLRPPASTRSTRRRGRSLPGEGEVYIGSGVESMSRAPWSMPKPDRVPTFAPPEMYDTTVGWRFNNPRMEALYPIISLGETAENIADEMQITRHEQDAFALESQRRAVAAIDAGRFVDEIVPIEVPQRRGDAIVVDTDEHPRYDKDNGHYTLAATLEDLARLKPAFRQGGTVTAGNSSGINDGAAALLVTSREAAGDLGLAPMVRLVGAASAGVDPGVMGYGPVPATQKLLRRFGLSIDDIGLVEINEAFAAQALGCMRRLGLRAEITNVNGGAIALGHPLGCSGARLLVTLIHEMKRRAAGEKRPFYGLASLCVGVGMGVSTLVEWIGD